MIKKTIKSKWLIFIGILSINILILAALDLVEGFLELSMPEIDGKENILDNIIFYSIFLIFLAPILEEVLYRLPLKRNSFTFFSLLVGVIYILIFDLLLIRIVLGIYLISIIYLRVWKKEISKVFIVISIFVFTISHIGNYGLLDIQSMNLLAFMFLFLPQLILGIIVSFLRIEFSFNYALLYHVLYNAIIILFAINFD